MEQGLAVGEVVVGPGCEGEGGSQISSDMGGGGQESSYMEGGGLVKALPWLAAP